jgi:hypothetical protein
LRNVPHRRPIVAPRRCRIVKSGGPDLSGFQNLTGLGRASFPRFTAIEANAVCLAEADSTPRHHEKRYADTLVKVWLRDDGDEQGREQGMAQGMHQGLLKAIRLGLELKFGSKGLKLYPEVSKISDVALLDAVSEALLVAETLDEVRQIYVDALPQAT